MNLYKIPEFFPAYISFPISLRETFTFLLLTSIGTCEAICGGQPKISSLQSINKSSLLNVPHGMVK